MTASKIRSAERAALALSITKHQAAQASFAALSTAAAPQTITQAFDRLAETDRRLAEAIGAVIRAEPILQDVVHIYETSRKHFEVMAAIMRLLDKAGANLAGDQAWEPAVNLRARLGDESPWPTVIRNLATDPDALDAMG